MNDKWHSLSILNGITEGVISATVNVEADSCWFRGHFPGDPVLPGIAQLAMVYDAIKEYNLNLKIIQIQRVKFKHIVRPNEVLGIRVERSRNKENSYNFTVMAGDNLASSGTLLTEMTE